MAKERKPLLTTKELCKKLQIHRHRLEKMVADGLPVAGKQKTRGRPTWMFDPDTVAVWAIANGRDIPAIVGEQIKLAVTKKNACPQTNPKPAPTDTPATQPDAVLEPIELQLQSERSQYAKLFARFLKTHASDDPAGVAALAKTITQKSDSLRRLELSVVEYRRYAGELVELATVKQLFYELASGTRDRITALPTQLTPLLRDFLRDPDDAGQVYNLIDKEVRHTLTALPDELPKMETKK